MEDACEATMRVLGLPGLFAIVFVIEAFPLPLPYVAVVYVALKGGTRTSLITLFFFFLGESEIHILSNWACVV